MFWNWQVLMITARTVGGLETVEEIDRELTKVVEDFHCAVNVEDLRRTKETGKHSLSQPLDSSFSIVSCRT